MDQEKIGKFLAQLRKETNLTQEEVADKLGISRQSISKWERGDCMPDAINMGPLCKLYGVNISEIFSGERNKKGVEINANDEKALIISQKEETEKVLLKINDDRQKQKKRNKILLIIISVLLLIITLFLAYYFIIYYNSISVYTIKANGENAVIEDGIIVKTKEKVYFKTDEVISKNEIENMRLYYINSENKEINIYACNNCERTNISFTDFKGYSEYLNFSDFDEIINNMRLELVYASDEGTECLDIEIKKDFSSNKLLFVEESIISKNSNKENYSYDTSLTKQLQETFNKKEDGYVKNIILNSKKITANLIDDNLIIESHDDTYEFLWSYNILSNLLTYEKIKKEKTIERATIDYKNKEIIQGNSNNKEKIITEFKEILEELLKK